MDPWKHESRTWTGLGQNRDLRSWDIICIWVSARIELIVIDWVWPTLLPCLFSLSSYISPIYLPISFPNFQVWSWISHLRIRWSNLKLRLHPFQPAHYVSHCQSVLSKSCRCTFLRRSRGIFPVHKSLMRAFLQL